MDSARRSCRVLAGWIGQLSGVIQLPSWKNENGWVAMQCRSEHLRPLDTKVDATILDTRNGRLGDAAQFGELVLAEILQFTDDANRFPGRDIHALLGRNEIFHVNDSDNREG